MKVIGICGRSGSGKSTVGKIIKNKYSAYIDCDTVSRDVTKKDSLCLVELVTHFGSDILCEDGSLNRKMLSSMVFGDKEKLKVLNAVTHKYILEEIKNSVERFLLSGEKVVFLDAPTLFESGLYKKCDFILSVIADEEILVQRIAKRDGKTFEEARKRLSSQLDEQFLVKNSDFVIKNNGTLEELIEKTNYFIQEVEKLL